MTGMSASTWTRSPASPLGAGPGTAFAGRAAQIAAVRAWAQGLLPPGCPRADDVAIVVSELATNAVLHSASGEPGGTFTVQLVVQAALEGGQGVIELSVTDQGPARACVPRPAGECGRGLDIVADLADAYEVVTRPDGRRTAWCRLDWPQTGTPCPVCPSDKPAVVVRQPEAGR